MAVIFVLIFAVSCENSKKDDKETIDTDTTDTENPDGDNADSSDTEPTEQTDTDTEKPDTGDSAHDDDADTSDTGKPDSDNDDADSENDDDADSENDDDADTEEEPVEKHELIGRYTGYYNGSFAGENIISNTAWFQPSEWGDSLFHITQFNSEEDFIIAQNDAVKSFNPEKWSRFDYVIDGEDIYYCQIAYEEETEEAALAVTTADRTDLATSGCNGSPWTKLIKVVETGIDKDDAKIVAWATGYKDYTVGKGVAESWQTPEKALGKAVGDSYDVVVLGDGGTITMTFDMPIVNGEGADFAVFENSFNDTFLELGTVEVSSDGENFVAFDNFYLGTEKIGGTGGHDASLIWGFAGKFRQGEGTLFDLAELAEKPEVKEGKVNLDAISFVKIVDVIGDGKQKDSIGNPIYDPHPTGEISAGFDLDAVAVINAMPKAEFEVEITGKYTDGWSVHKISNFDWVMGDSVFHFTKYDKDEDFMIAYNTGSNQWNPGKWSRFDYTEKDGELYYCQTSYAAASEEEALATTAADKTDPATSGCGGLAWTKLSETLSIIGKWYEYQSGTKHMISNKGWQQDNTLWEYSSFYRIEKFDNTSGVAIAYAEIASTIGYSKMEYIIGEDEIYYCEISYGNATIEDAENAEGANRTNLKNGCNGSPWSALVPAGDDKDMYAETLNPIELDDTSLKLWATGYAEGSYNPGEDVEEEDKTPNEALGAADGKTVALGDGGSIILTFEPAIKGEYFVVFGKNLAKVEVSSDGTNYVAFDTFYFGSAISETDPDLYFGFAGLFDDGKGVQFDLEDLVVKEDVIDETVDIEAITHIRITDVKGNGSEFDALGDQIYDPYPTNGFELDAIGAIE